LIPARMPPQPPDAVNQTLPERFPHLGPPVLSAARMRDSLVSAAVQKPGFSSKPGFWGLTERRSVPPAAGREGENCTRPLTFQSRRTHLLCRPALFSSRLAARPRRAAKRNVPLVVRS